MGEAQKISGTMRATGKPFKKGEGGRPKGIPNKNTKVVKEVFINVFSDLQSDPKANLKSWAKDNPGEFYKIVSKLFPIQLANGGEGENFNITLNLNT